uniref:NAD(P)H-quinone oxidoreductase subunit 5, chloroplastic n=2 Tax=Dipteris conjugata TaxID=32108 RepID=A0A385GP90_9MONI|nr:NADH-plastoquinone oxidoreductase subunit 5 [Dipteris conjugata]
MELSYECAWIVPSRPFVTSGLIGLASFLFPKATKSLRRIRAMLSVLSLAAAMSVSIATFWQQVTGRSTFEYSWSWIPNDDISPKIGFSVDSLTSITSISVTTIGVLVMIYSDSHMRHDQGYVRFPVYLSFSTASTSGLVFSPNPIQIHVFRELVGMCSYSPIGFWFARPSAANACQKAFATNRTGDFGLLLGILGTYWITGSFEIRESCDRFSELIDNNSAGSSLANTCAPLPFLGPVSKSAQSPLHVWLPDATEGPTPISALIHAATMVAAGIFFVARMLELFETLPLSMNVISWIGGITALLGATIALAQKDIKKGLAYSTMSQLGYMMLALGLGAYKPSLFHLITHAHPKALLFPGSGSVIHSMERVVGYSPNRSQNMSPTGGSRKYMPITGITFLSGTLSLCGIPPLARFRSKDEIIAKSWLRSFPPGCIASFTAVPTAFYMFRIYLLTFEGNFRAGGGTNSSHSSMNSVIRSNTKTIATSGDGYDVPPPPRDEGVDSAGGYDGEDSVDRKVSAESNIRSESLYPKESDVSMVLPSVVLSIPTSLVGSIGVNLAGGETGPDLLSGWLTPLAGFSEDNNNPENLVQLLIDSAGSVGLSLAGISISYVIYGPISSHTQPCGDIDPFAKQSMGSFNRLIGDWSHNRGYIDHYYDILLVRGIRFLGELTLLFDQWVIDGIINGTGILSSIGGESARYGEGGRVSSYSFGLMIGIILLLTAFVSLVS